MPSPTLPHHTKAKKLVELLESLGDEKVIVFTQYRATQYYLQWYLISMTFRPSAFPAALKRGKKDWIQQLFKDRLPSVDRYRGRR